VAYDFGGTGGCNESKEVIIKAWKGMDEEDYQTESKVYEILSSTEPPMKGFPALIQAKRDADSNVLAVVLEKLGPSLEDLCNLMRQHQITRFSEKMTLALAIGSCLVFLFHLVIESYTLTSSYKLDRYAALHERGIIHNGAKPGNICLASPSSNACTLNLIDFGYSFFRNEMRLTCGGEFSGNKRFWSALSHNGYSTSFSPRLFFLYC
jgi:serine/threonine protein kinase